jgi:heptosyltransferase-2
MRILVIQTAFIGDAILATGILEKLHQQQPQAHIDLLVRKGNESLFAAHPFVHTLWVWNKQKHKYRHLWQLLLQIRAQKYDLVLNLQRFLATGLLTAFSGAKKTIGFDKNPLSWLFSERVPHAIAAGTHEIARNHRLIAALSDGEPALPRLYPSPADYEAVATYQAQAYICIAPTSVWFTKQLPAAAWVALLQQLPPDKLVYLLGAPSDQAACQAIMEQGRHPQAFNLAGKLSLLQSAALMQKAMLNYVNDSAPMHLASAVNAPTVAVFCSTIPDFGFGPLSEQAWIVQSAEALACRPCGLHGKAQCPLGHFRCATSITTTQLLELLPE